MTIGLAVVSFNRPEYLEKSLKAVVRHLDGVIDDLIVVNDGSDPKHSGSYKRAYKAAEAIGGVIDELPQNVGVAKAKNHGMRYLLDRGHDWIFVLEDDIVVQSPHAVTSYIETSLATDIHHLSFAHHGPANAGGPVDGTDWVMFYPHSVGAWTMFTSECLKDVGLLDENMLNAFEHVEHEMRLFQAGYMPDCGPHRFPDAIGSRAWLQEIPGSLERSSIRPRKDWSVNIRNSLVYWCNEKPETFSMLFGEGMPLQAYAQSIIGGGA